MVDQELVDWIKSEKAKGHSKQDLVNILSEQNHPSKDIEKAFDSLNGKKMVPFSILFVLLSGLGLISLVLITIILTFSLGLTGGTENLGYFLIFLSGTVISYYIYHIKEKINSTEALGAILGVFSPILPLILILSSLKIIQDVSKQLSMFSTPDVGFASMLDIFTLIMDPIIAGALFYFSCNIFVIFSIIKNKKYSTILWYLIAPVLFYILWFVIDLLTSSIVGFMNPSSIFGSIF